MDAIRGVLVCFLLLGPSYSQAQHVPRDNSNIVFAPPSANPPPVRAQQRPVETNTIYRRPAQPAPPPQQQRVVQRRPEVNTVYQRGGLRPTKDTDGAIYQKTVGGVAFKIVSMCQEFDTVFKPGLMEFDTLQGGCRFVITFDKKLPTTQTVYTPGPVYSASSAVNPYYQSQAVERRREYYNQPPEPAVQQRAPPRTVVVREPAYPPRQSYPPPRQEPTRVVRYQSAPAPPPAQDAQYPPRAAPAAQPAARPAYQPPPPTVVRVQPARRYEPARAPSGPPPKRGLDRYQLEALGVGTLHDPPIPAVTVPPQSEPPIPRV
ncbi:hypothetical protein LOTGIDRAFT_236689 [Lottia gigantea]|uniref:Uncharacterized protein n=1 Tax=Lottia gigantea TaxID=225164 RepID=V3ZR76_LOTGI|nr:hypothetical protein LOTGIDRAFT_236689 [Lottia gigantea]ESO83371.1 hypothetical protein LOTGIDRAFT_236689 [Lottia gigantea]